VFFNFEFPLGVEFFLLQFLKFFKRLLISFRLNFVPKCEIVFLTPISLKVHMLYEKCTCYMKSAHA
jgi:hypothetical protein